MAPRSRPFRSRFWRAPVETEVDRELDFHVDMRTREYIAAGMDPKEAREAAIRRFGNLDRVRSTCRTIGEQRERDLQRTEYFAELRQDVTFAVRQLVKARGFTTVALLTLALGIGATTAIFSAVRAVVLKPLPIPDLDRVLAIYEGREGHPDWQGNVSAGNFTDLRSEATTFESIAALQYSSFNLSATDTPERIIGARTTASFFDIMRTPPLLGRVFDAAEDEPGREQVVVLSHRLWTRLFAADRGVVGRTVRMNGATYSIIGVMPQSFDLTVGTEDLWVPIAFTAARKATHDEHYLTVYGRLKQGVSPDRAAADSLAIAKRLRERFPRDDVDLTFTFQPFMEQFVGNYRQRLFVLLGAVAFVLLIACGNVANLLLARGAARSREIAVRAALGAGRGRIVRQLLTESAVLALVASVFGVAFASWGARVLIAMSPRGVPRLEQTEVDAVVLAFTLGLAILSSLVFGLAPAMRAARPQVHDALREGARGTTGGVRDRLRMTLIAAEVGLALLLLVGAGLLIRSAIELQRVRPGFDPTAVLSARISLPIPSYADPQRATQTFERLVDSASALSRVQQAAAVSQAPMGPGGNSNGLIPEGRPFDIRNAINSRLRIVTPGYFETMRIPMLRGRGFTAADRRGAPKVMVVSEALARAAWPGQDPLGKRIACCEPGPDGKSPDWKIVVGVAGDVRSRALREAPAPEFYLPMRQIPNEAWAWIQRTMYVVARVDGNSPGIVTSEMRTAFSRVDPDVPLFDVRPMEERVALSMATARFNTVLLSVLGAIGLLLSAIGIYGVISYFVAQRTHEIGVRMALGATSRDVVLLVIRQAAWPVLIGLVAGTGASFALTRVLQEQLFGVSPRDPVTLVAVFIALAAVGLLASSVPARRAAHVEPTAALQTL